MTRLTDRLAAMGGVDRAHVVAEAGEAPAQLCVHNDPAVVALPRIRRAAEAAGAQLTERYGHVVWPVSGLGHQRRARTVAETLRGMPGVVEAEANATGPLRIEFDRRETNEAQLRRALADLRVSPESADPHAGHDHGPDAGHDRHEPESDDHAGHDHAPSAHDHAHGGIFGERTEVIFAVLAGLCVGTGWLLSLSDTPESVSLALYLGAYAFGGWFTVREAWESIRAGRFEIDFPDDRRGGGRGGAGRVV